MQKKFQERHDHADDFFKQHFNFTQDELSAGATDVTDQVQNSEDWFSTEFEGQLSVDVYQTQNDVVVKSTIAGVKPEDLDIFVDNDMLTIRGRRVLEEEIKDNDYFYRECYWGGFSRSIILPVDVNFDQIKASLDNGVLTIRLPKMEKTKKIKVKVVDTD